MSNDDRIRLNIEAKVSEIEKANSQLEKMRKSLVANAAQVKGLAKDFTSFNGVVSKSVTELRKFDRNLKEVSKGTAFDRINRSMLELQKNTAKAGKDLQALRLASGSMPRAYDDKAVLLKAQELRVGQRLLDLERNRNAVTEKKYQDSLRDLKVLQDKVALEKQSRSIEMQTAGLKARAANPEFQAAVRQNKEASILGDGGAALFKIQASLLVNYGLMNQLFNLFSFGSQFVLQLDKAFQELQAITATTNTEMQGLKDTIISVSEGTKFTAVEVAEAATVLGQAGFSAQQIKDSIEGVTLLATATGSTLALSVDVASSAVSIFGLRAEDMSRVANVMTGAINETKLTMDKLAQGFQYAGNIAAEAGLTFEETTAVLGAMANAGIRSGSTLGTGLRQVLIELINPSKKFIKNLQDVGLTVEDIDVKSKGFVGVMKTLRDAGFNTADAFESFEVRSAAAFAAIQNNPQILEDLQRAFIFTNAAAKANEIQMGSLSNKIAQFTSVLGTFIYQLSGPLVSAFKIFIDGTGSLIGAMNKLGFVVPLLGTALLSFGIALPIVKVWSLVAGLTATATTLGTVATATTAAKFALLGFVSPLVAVTAGIAALVGGIYLYDRATSSLNASIDETQAKLDSSEGQYAKTKEATASVTSEIDRLTDRLGTLKDSPSQVFTEMLSLQNQFTDIGFEIEETVNPSIYDLINALTKLQQKLKETSAEQLKLSLIERERLFAQQTRKVNSSPFSGKSYLTTGYQATLGSSAAAKAVGTGLNSVSSQLSDLKNTNLSDLDATGRQQLVARIAKTKNQLDKLNTTASKYLLSLEKAGEEGSKEYNEMKDIQAKINIQLGQVGEIGANITSYTADITKQVTEAFSNTDLAKAVSDEIQKYNEQLSILKQKAAEAGEKEKPAIIAQIAALEKTIEDSIMGLLKGNMAKTAEALRAAGLEVNDDTVSMLTDIVKTDLKQTQEEGKQYVENATEALGDKVDEAFEVAANGLENIKDAYARVTDKIDTEIQRLDVISRETTDLERGGLAGKYSDAELSVFEDRKKRLQAASIQKKIDFLPQVIGSTGALANEQQRIVNEKKTSKDVTERLKAERDLNKTLMEKAQYEEELVRLQNELNAINGVATEANMALGDQIKYVISQYSRQAEVQSTWSYGIKENVIKVLDDSRSSFGQFVRDVASGTDSIGGSFKKMASSILESMLEITSNKLASQILGGASGFLGNLLGVGIGKGYSAPIGPTASGAPLPAISLNGFNNGGIIKANSGAYIGRDSQLVLAQQGEGVLSRSAMAVLGRDNLNQLNAMGNRQFSAASNNVNGLAKPEGGASQPTIMNVYVVSPDQKPSLTKNDVIVTIAEDLSRGGPTKKLVKSIVTGG